MVKKMRDFLEQTLAVDPREDKLPRWAQEKLNNLRRETFRSEKALEDFKTGAKSGPFYVDDYDGSNPFFLPARGSLKFGKPGDLHNQISLHDDGKGVLRIQGGHSLIVQPHASNVIHVKVEK